MKVFLCESCGAPIEAPWSELVIVCSYCGNHNFQGKALRPVPPRVPADGRPRLNLGGRTYVIEGPLGTGDSTRVYRARWVMRLGELVFIKVLLASEDAELLRNEWQVLGQLRRSTAEGATHFVTRLPSTAAHGIVDTDRPRLTSVFGWLPGFSHTLEAVQQEYPSGVDGRIGVWMLARLLELLGFIHRSGVVHGAITPEHILIHPRDHGAILIGWTLAQTWRQGSVKRLPAVPKRWASLYASERRATPELDIAMACACIDGAASFDRRVRRVVSRGRRGESDAWRLSEDLKQASRQAYGPPSYHPLSLSGWRTPT